MSDAILFIVIFGIVLIITCGRMYSATKLFEYSVYEFVILPVPRALRHWDTSCSSVKPQWSPPPDIDMRCLRRGNPPKPKRGSHTHTHTHIRLKIARSERGLSLHLSNYPGVKSPSPGWVSPWHPRQSTTTTCAAHPPGACHTFTLTRRAFIWSHHRHRCVVERTHSPPGV